MKASGFSLEQTRSTIGSVESATTLRLVGNIACDELERCYKHVDKLERALGKIIKAADDCELSDEEINLGRGVLAAGQ